MYRDILMIPTEADLDNTLCSEYGNFMTKFLLDISEKETA